MVTTRCEAQEKLLERYAGYFDISYPQEEQVPLVALCEFHEHSEKYVLSRKAKLWQANSHEYIYLFSVSHLTEDLYHTFENYAYTHGMEKIQPGPEHMYSYITVMVLCDTCDEAAQRAVRRCRIYHSFRLSFWGWMDFHTSLAVLSDRKAFSNAGGKSAAQLLETTLFDKAKQKTTLLRREKTI